MLGSAADLQWMSPLGVQGFSDLEIGTDRRNKRQVRARSAAALKNFTSTAKLFC